MNQENNYFIRSGFSFFNSLLQIDDLISFAKTRNWKQIALIDQNIMYGSYDFIKKAKANNLLPIIGLEIKLESHHLIAIAKNFIGYKILLKISSSLNEISPYFDESLLQNDNLVLINGVQNFKFANYILDKDKKTFELFQKIANLVPKHLDVSLENGINDFPNEQIEALNILKTIPFSMDYEFVSYKETLNVFEKEDSTLQLKNQLETAFKKMLKENNINDSMPYEKRLNYEFKIVNEMNFIDYFLIVSDYVNWAKDQSIFVGPGRGSAPGSLISYLLKITDVDPIENDLIFERFLNPERVSVPDIDIDFQDDRREEIITYLKTKYGEKNVAQIVTFQTFQAKNTIKDISRIYDISFQKVNQLTKMFFDKLTLKQNLKRKEVVAFLKENPIFEEIIMHAKKLIGLPRQTSTHAAGIIISKNPISHIVPTMINGSNMLQTQYSMDFLEEHGLIKFDLLGLKNLSTLKNIFEMIQKTRNTSSAILTKFVPDPKVFKMLSQGKTMGVFQLESSGMKSVLEKVEVDNFEDLIAIISLFRPGPQKNIDVFSDRKHHKVPINYYDSLLEPILKNTYGIIVYQEQILDILKRYANYDYAQADLFRRAISKKDGQKLEQLKSDFLSKSLENNRNQKTSEIIFDAILEFANYGFNRSHAYAYALISYNFAYYKYHYPIEFASVFLSTLEKNPKKLLEFLNEFETKITLLPPSINRSFANFSLEPKGIRIGFNLISGLGLETVNKIKQAKQVNKQFNNVYEALITLSAFKVSKKTIEALIMVGCFDEFNYSRESLLAILDSILKLTKMVLNKDGKVDLTILEDDDFPSIPSIKDTKNENYEEKLLGFKLS